MMITTFGELMLRLTATETSVLPKQAILKPTSAVQKPTLPFSSAA